ncbi:MAG: hypothetical protein QXI18_03930 [Nitrososphaerota archaeon]
MDAAIEWMRRYEYRLCGRERWMRRDQQISREQAEAELQAYLSLKRKAAEISEARDNPLPQPLFLPLHYIIS